MSSQQSSPSWQWSESRKQRYFIDTRRNMFVLEDGTEFPASRDPGAAQSRPGQPQSTPTQQQQANAAARQQRQQWGTYQPTPLRPLQQNTGATAVPRSMQPNRSFGTGMTQSQQPAFQLRSIQERTDPATGVTTRVGYGPNGETYLLGTKGAQEPLNSNYQVQSNPERFFTAGRVFYTLWTEPTAASDMTVVTPVRYSENGICRIRRFVVIKEGEGYCQAVPIRTYEGQGLNERGAMASKHGLVYMGNQPPQRDNSDAGLMDIALCINPVNGDEAMNPLARINFGKVYTIEHSLKVREVGSITNVADLERGVSQAGQQQVPPRISARRPGPPFSTGNPGPRTQSIRGRGNRTTAQPRNVAGRAAYSQSCRDRDDEEDDEDEDEDDEEEQEEEDSDGDNDPRNKRPRRVSFQLSSRGRGEYSGFQRSRGQSAYQYSQR